jgi:hypothetical protein
MMEELEGYDGATPGRVQGSTLKVMRLLSSGSLICFMAILLTSLG